MQAAFGFVCTLPSAASVRSFIGTMGTSDGGITLRYERMLRKVEFVVIPASEIRLHIDQRIEFDDVTTFLKELQAAAEWRLVRHQSRHPDLIPFLYPV